MHQFTVTSFRASDSLGVAAFDFGLHQCGEFLQNAQLVRPEFMGFLVHQTKGPNALAGWPAQRHARIKAQAKIAGKDIVVVEFRNPVVPVPKDFTADQRLIWTIVVNGQAASIPLRLHPDYVLTHRITPVTARTTTL